VVLVEDNETFRQTLELLLGLRGDIDVIGAVATGSEAIALSARLRPDVVLMDYRMPGIDGAEATAGVLAASPRSRVVCLTASVSGDEIGRLRAAGAVACLTKDVELDAIIGAIHAAAASPSPA